jgi:hypothetical protein
MTFEAFMVVNIMIVVFRDVTPCSVKGDTNVSEKPAASFFIVLLR